VDQWRKLFEQKAARLFIKADSKQQLPKSVRNASRFRQMQTNKRIFRSSTNRFDPSRGE
jgi:hypothetical protein